MKRRYEKIAHPPTMKQKARGSAVDEARAKAIEEGRAKRQQFMSTPNRTVPARKPKK